MFYSLLISEQTLVSVMLQLLSYAKSLLGGIDGLYVIIYSFWPRLNNNYFVSFEILTLVWVLFICVAVNDHLVVGWEQDLSETLCLKGTCERENVMYATCQQHLIPFIASLQYV